MRYPIISAGISVDRWLDTRENTKGVKKYAIIAIINERFGSISCAMNISAITIAENAINASINNPIAPPMLVGIGIATPPIITIKKYYNMCYLKFIMKNLIILLIILLSIVVIPTEKTKCGSPCFIEELKTIGINDINNNCIDITTYISQRYCCFDEDCGSDEKCINGICEFSVLTKIMKPLETIQIYYDEGKIDITNTIPMRDKINILFVKDVETNENIETLANEFSTILLNVISIDLQIYLLHPEYASKYLQKFNILYSTINVTCDENTCNKLKLYADPFFNSIDVVVILSKYQRCSGNVIVLDLSDKEMAKRSFLKYIGHVFGLSDEFDAKPYYAVEQYPNLFETKENCLFYQQEKLSFKTFDIKQSECEAVDKMWRISKIKKIRENTDKVVEIEEPNNNIMHDNTNRYGLWNIRRVAYVLEHLDKKHTLLQRC